MKSLKVKIVGLVWLVTTCSILLYSNATIYARTVRDQQELDKRTQFIECFIKLGASRDVAEAIIDKNPRLLEHNLENNIKPKFNYFLDELELAGGEFFETLLRSSWFMTSSLEEHIKPVVSYLADETELSEQEIGQWILYAAKKSPLHMKPYFISHGIQILDYGLEGNIKPKIELMKYLGFQTGESLLSEFVEILPLNLRCCELIIEMIPEQATSGEMIKLIYYRINYRLYRNYGKRVSQLIEAGFEDWVRAEIVDFSGDD